jgi:RhtB (resistance to homoserine/threonine) family protein
MHDYWVEFIKVAVAHFLAVASPGPDFAIVLKQSMSRGRRAALWTSVGVGTAILLHVTYSLLGLGLLIRSSELWFNVVKYAGAGYLAWLGVQSLRSKPKREKPVETESVAGGRRGEGRAFMLGFWTNALNPKATLFFISLFAVIISPTTPKLWQAGYGAYMAIATAAWFSFVSVVFAQPEARRVYWRHGHWIDRALGVVFLGFAVSLLVAEVR